MSALVNGLHEPYLVTMLMEQHSDKSCCYPWFLSHDKTLDQQYMLTQARHPMINHLTNIYTCVLCDTYSVNSFLHVQLYQAVITLII